MRRKTKRISFLSYVTNLTCRHLFIHLFLNNQNIVEKKKPKTRNECSAEKDTTVKFEECNFCQAFEKQGKNHTFILYNCHVPSIMKCLSIFAFGWFPCMLISQAVTLFLCMCRSVANLSRPVHPTKIAFSIQSISSSCCGFSASIFLTCTHLNWHNVLQQKIGNEKAITWFEIVHQCVRNHN